MSEVTLIELRLVEQAISDLRAILEAQTFDEFHNRGGGAYGKGWTALNLIENFLSATKGTAVSS